MAFIISSAPTIIVIPSYISYGYIPDFKKNWKIYFKSLISLFNARIDYGINCAIVSSYLNIYCSNYGSTV